MPQAPPEPLYVLRGHRAAVQCVSFAPSCKALAAGDAEGELKLWDLDSQRPTASIRAHDSTSGILQVACPSSNPWVVSQGRDGVVKCWSLHSDSSFSSQPVQQLSTGCYNFCRFALLEGGQTSSSCCSSQAQPAASREPLPARHVIDGFAAATADAKTSSSTPSVSASEAIAAQQQQQLQGSQTTRQSAEGLLSQALQQQQAQTHPTSSPCTHQQQQTAACEQDLAALALQQSSMQAVDAAGEESPAGAAAAAAAAAQDDLTEAAEEQLMLRDTTGTNSSSSSSSSTGHGGAASSTASILGSGSWGPCYLAMPADDPAHLGVWQLGGGGSSRSSSSSQRPLMLLQQSKGPDRPHRGQCMAVVLLQPQGLPLHALTGYEDGSVALWDTRSSSTYLAAQKLHSEPVMCLAAAADCSRGLSGSADDKLASFDLDIARGQLRAGAVHVLPQQGLADVAVRPDGRIAATAGWDAKVRVWHVRKRQPLAILRWHSQQVACVGFSRDSMLLAAGGRDNAISMWSLYPPNVPGS